MALSQKLTDAFNKNAGKIIKTSEWNARMEVELRSTLSQKQYTQMEKALTSKRNAIKTQKLGETMEKEKIQEELVAASQDGTIGFYNDNASDLHEEYFNVNALRFSFENQETKDLMIRYPKTIEKKILEASAIVIEEVHDYRDDVKAGTLTLTPKM